MVPSDSLKIFHDDNVDLIFLLNYGKSDVTGQVFGYKVYNHFVDKITDNDIPVIQIERPGEDDGSIIGWNNDLDIVNELSQKLNLAIVTPQDVYDNHISLEIHCPFKEKERIGGRFLWNRSFGLKLAPLYGL